MRARAFLAGLVGSFGSGMAVQMAFRDIWWPLVLVAVACAVLVYLGRRNDREILRLLAERRRIRNEERR